MFNFRFLRAILASLLLTISIVLIPFVFGLLYAIGILISDDLVGALNPILGPVVPLLLFVLNFLLAWYFSLFYFKKAACNIFSGILLGVLFVIIPLFFLLLFFMFAQFTTAVDPTGMKGTIDRLLSTKSILTNLGVLIVPMIVAYFKK